MNGSTSIWNTTPTYLSQDSKPVTSSVHTTLQSARFTKMLHLQLHVKEKEDTSLLKYVKNGNALLQCRDGEKDQWDIL